MENKKTKIRECFHCGNRAPMEIVATYKDSIMYGEPPYTDNDDYTWLLLICPSCKRPTLEEIFKTSFEAELDGWPVHDRILYPSEINLEGLPEGVKKSYEAALKVRNVEPNAFAVLIGRTLDIICKDRNAKGDTLYQKLTDLSNRNEIPGRLTEMAQGLRLLRNIGAHADLGEIVKEDIPILIALCEAILEYLYRAPSHLKLLQSRIELLKKKTSNEE
jgi:hypothetical protein